MTNPRAPAIALAATLGAFFIAHTLDLSPAHTAVALLGAALPIAWWTARS